MRVGIGFTPFETRAEVVLAVGVRAEELGFEQVGVAEGWTHDGLVVLAELALRTSRIGLASSVLSVWGRTPATIAMGAAGLQRCSGGRFTLGLGAGSPPLAEGLHGLAWERPVARLRDTTAAVRALLAGERLPGPAAGARPLRLGLVPDPPVPIALAALSPASVRLAGELADAWTPFLWARGRIHEGRALLREGAARAGRPAPAQVAMCVPVALAADENAARRLAAWWLGTYVTRMGPLYPRMLSDTFGAGPVEALTRAAADRDPELPAAAEDLAREVTLLGAHAEAGSAVRSWIAAGADTVHLVLPPGRPEAEVLEVLDVVAHAMASAGAAA
jgi:alkanesulfonate monooxygenase SsuD/methylene tetrahydromethanopterin reductase-like flavin-dependent oxidoreductase (luciferase family)